MGGWFEASRFVRHLWKSKGPHGVHSPFVYNLITRVLPSARETRGVLKDVEQYRAELLNDSREITVVDFGAGSRRMNSSRRSVAEIARYASSPRAQTRALFSLVREFSPQRILELGTSLGVGTMAMSKGFPDAEIMTIEGDPAIAEIARSGFEKWGVASVQQFTGTFEDQLPRVIESRSQIDFCVMDGNHRYEPTICYFNHILPILSENAVVFIDDIHWSAEMEKAWNELASRAEVSLSIDFFHFGLLFLSRRLTREGFVLRLPS